MKIKTMVRCAIASVTVAFALVPVVARACDHGNGMAHGAQAYGPQHSLRRPVWIQPTLVGKDRISGEVAHPAYVIQ